MAKQSPNANERAEGVVYDTQQMLAWWNDYTKAMGERTVPKAIEYGGSDLAVMGHAMTALLNLEPGDNILGQMAALAFYMQGKLGRIMSALAEGRMPDPDHEFDLAVYSVMFRRVRETGNWP